MNPRHLADARIVRREPAAVDDVWARVNCPPEPSACWHWLGRRDRSGRAVLRVWHLTVCAVRVATYAVSGEYPSAARFRHTCADAACVRPSHVRWSTSAVHRREVAAYSDGYGRMPDTAPIAEERAAASARSSVRLAS